jgi:cell division protein FtsZ
VNEAAALIKETAHPDVNLIFGAVVDENAGDEIRITVIATGFEQTHVPTRRPAAGARERLPISQPKAASVPAPAPRPAPRPAQPESPAPAAEDRPEASLAQPPQPQPQPVRRVEEEFTSRVYDTDDLDIPAFLRRNNR